jgi:polyphosphate kinase
MCRAAPRYMLFAVMAEAQPVVSIHAGAEAAERVPLFNRELSWLEFNARVLAEAENPEVPLLERLKFVAITSSNLDEFFMVRGGGLKDLIDAGITAPSPDGMTPAQQWKAVRVRSKALLERLYACWSQSIVPRLKKEKIRIVGRDELSKKERAALTSYFVRRIEPILTPMATDPGHPIPFLANLALNIGLHLQGPSGESSIAFLKLPQSVPRLIEVPGSSKLILLEEIVAANAGLLFPGFKVRSAVPVRVIRNADIAVREDEVEDLLKSVESEIRQRQRKDVVWVEIGKGAPRALTELIMEATDTPPEDIFETDGPLKLSDFMQAYGVKGKAALRDALFIPRMPQQLSIGEDVFSVIRRGDMLLHRPYDSFGAVVEFVRAAAADPDVLAIKLTLYRADNGSPIVAALADASRRGKQVTAIVELQARFDEMKNIEWARTLEQAGVQVVYGLVGIKTHCKVCLVVRREGGALRRYVHLSTGNYNARTGTQYTDIDLFTANEDFGEDASQLMNILTGYSIASVQTIFDGTAPKLHWRRFSVAPINYHQTIVGLIRREIARAQEGLGGHIVAKLNSLVDRRVIKVLYEASRAGVKIDLLVRGICCLVPRLPGVSDNIRVHAVIDRFLEHTRIFYFRNGGDVEVYVTSGDWMPRNFYRRIELMFPILDDALRTRLVEEILRICLADDVKAWSLRSDGTYKRRTKGKVPVRSQQVFLDLARVESTVGSYIDPGTLREKKQKSKK